MGIGGLLTAVGFALLAHCAWGVSSCECCVLLLPPCCVIHAAAAVVAKDVVPC